ncbi:ribulose-phosphate 3-epimerase [Natranaerobius trueperi]|uniref:Ribulose-phosphate 3-epimerase n=1 Tax=Natranaerobius trueperi TaxID=759412 RepID=A0A226BZF1_9FIRM|nr:ribulose-phosphate 3-epimerase [Natranaerobius trueperi]OWZ84172.1 ribulose-phosphate 3-epimerase [Natranaerobius trueperi]
MTIISPSILSADMLNLKDQIKQVENGGAEMVHIDVMDGHFVPNITMGPWIVKSLSKVSSLERDVHLMIERPENYIDDFCESGAEIVTIHQEASTHLDRNIAKIKNNGCKAGVSINPATPIEQIKWILTKVDLVLIMSVNPGFGGQKFINYSLDKIKELNKIRYENGLDFFIQVDGGITNSNAFDVVKAGADILVAGSSVFSSELGIEKSVQLLKNASKAANV